MPRPPKPVDLPDDIPEELAEFAAHKHVINFQASEYNWRRVQEAARLESAKSDERITASDIIRRFVAQGLDSHPESDYLHDEAILVLKHEQDRDKRTMMHNALDTETDLTTD